MWEIVTRGISAYLADSSPEKAIIFDRPSYGAIEFGRKKLRDLTPKKIETVTRSQMRSSDPFAKDDPWFRSPGQAITPLKAPPTPSLQTRTRAQIRSLAERALVNDPLNAHALRILGLLYVQAVGQ